MVNVPVYEAMWYSMGIEKNCRKMLSMVCVCVCVCVRMCRGVRMKVLVSTYWTLPQKDDTVDHLTLDDLSVRYCYCIL